MRTQRGCFPAWPTAWPFKVIGWGSARQKLWADGNRSKKRENVTLPSFAKSMFEPAKVGLFEKDLLGAMRLPKHTRRSKESGPAPPCNRSCAKLSHTSQILWKNTRP